MPILLPLAFTDAGRLVGGDCMSFLPMGYLHVAVLLATPCRLGDSPFLCRLRSLLSVLHITAGILAALLLIVVITAYFAFRRKARSRPQRLP